MDETTDEAGQKASDFSDALQKKKSRVLDMLADGFSVTDAAEAVGRDRRTTWDWRKDPEYSAKWTAAIETGIAARQAHTQEVKESLGDKALRVLSDAMDGKEVTKAAITAAIFSCKTLLGMSETSHLEVHQVVAIVDDIPRDGD